MKCLRKYKWVKLPRMHLPSGKGLMGYWAKLASRAAFRKGNAVYCGHINPVTAGMWSGGVVGLKSILGVKKRVQALWIMNQLQDLGYMSAIPTPKVFPEQEAPQNSVWKPIRPPCWSRQLKPYTAEL